jgi:hypothetical protein
MEEDRPENTDLFDKVNQKMRHNIEKMMEEISSQD